MQLCISGDIWCIWDLHSTEAPDQGSSRRARRRPSLLLEARGFDLASDWPRSIVRRAEECRPLIQAGLRRLRHAPAERGQIRLSSEEGGAALRELVRLTRRPGRSTLVRPATD